MKPKNIKVKDDEISISFFDKGEEIIKDKIVEDFDKRQEAEKEDIKKTDTLTNDIKDREEVNEKILSSQKVFKQSTNRNYENSQNKIKNKIEEYNQYLVFATSILTIMALGWTIFYSFINNEYQNNRAKIFSIPKNYFEVNLYENIIIWIYILIPPLLFISYRNIDKIKKFFYFFNVFMESFFTIINMALWSDKLNLFFSRYSIYNKNQELFMWIFLIILIIIIIVTNFMLTKERKNKEINYFTCLGYLYSNSRNLKKKNREKWKNFIFILLYIGMLGLVYCGRGKTYERVIIEGQGISSEKIKIIIGEHKGIYAIATATMTDNGKIVIFETDNVELKKIEV